MSREEHHEIISSHFKLAVRLFETFAFVDDVEVGYPVLTKNGKLCRNTPHFYDQLPYGALRDMVGTLRDYEGNVVGLWDYGADCYVNPNVKEYNNRTCVGERSQQYADCDLDPRLQLNERIDAFALLKTLETLDRSCTIYPYTRDQLYSFAERIIQFSNKSIEVEGLNEIDRNAKFNALKSYFDTTSLTSQLTIQYYTEIIHSRFKRDFKRHIELLKDHYLRIGFYNIDLDKLYSSMDSIFNEMYTLYLNYSTIGIERFAEEGSNLLLLAQSLIDNIGLRWMMNRDQTDIIVQEVFVMTKTLSYMMNALVLNSFLFELSSWKESIKSCTYSSCIVDFEEIISIGDYHVNYLKDAIKNYEKKYLSEASGIDPCIPSTMEKVFQWEGSYTEALEWHNCIIQQKYKELQVLHLDFSKRASPENKLEKFISLEGLPIYVYSNLNIDDLLSNEGPSPSGDDDNKVLRLDNILKALPPYVPHTELVFRGYDPPNDTQYEPVYDCNDGYYGMNCEICPIGHYCKGGQLYICANAPEGVSKYTSPGMTSPNCDFVCLNDTLYRDGNTCRTPLIGKYYTGTTLEDCSFPSSIPNGLAVFTSPGLKGQKESCGYVLKWIIQGDIPKLINGSFTLQAWIKLDTKQLKQAVQEDATHGVAFSIIYINNTLNWYLLVREVNGTLVARMKIKDLNDDTDIKSWEFEPTDDWTLLSASHYIHIQYVTFMKDSNFMGSQWLKYTPKITKQTAIIGGFHATYPMEIPSKYRFLPASIHKIIIHNEALPVDALALRPKITSKECKEGEEWVRYRCLPKCPRDSWREHADTCICKWGYYMNEDRTECKWCSGVRVGSDGYKFKETDCFCLERYARNIENECVIAKPAFPEPKVILDKEQRPMQNQESYPIGTNITVTFPPEVFEAEDFHLIRLNVEIKVHMNPILKQDFYLESDLKETNYTWHYTFEQVGDYIMTMRLRQPGRVEGYHTGYVFKIKKRVRPPVLWPILNCTSSPRTLVLAPPTMDCNPPIDCTVIYSLDGNPPSHTYSSLSPPIMGVGATLRAITVHHNNPDLLPSEELVYHHKPCEGYGLGIIKKAETTAIERDPWNLFDWAARNPAYATYIVVGLITLPLWPYCVLLFCICWGLCMCNKKYQSRESKYKRKIKKKLDKKEVEEYKQLLQKNKNVNSAKCRNCMYKNYTKYRCLNCHHWNKYCAKCDTRVHKKTKDHDRVLMARCDRCFKLKRPLLFKPIEESKKDICYCIVCLQKERTEIPKCKAEVLKACYYCEKYVVAAGVGKNICCRVCYEKLKNDESFTLIDNIGADEKFKSAGSHPLISLSTGEYALTKYPFEARTQHEMTMQELQIVKIIERYYNDEWSIIEYENQQGLYPSNYLLAL